MPYSHLILCHPLLLLPSIPPSIRVFSNESTLRMRWPTYWSFSLSISLSDEHPGLVCPRDSQKSSPAPQFKSINFSALSFPHSPTLTILTSKTYKGIPNSKESACNSRDLGSIPGLEYPLEKGMATHSSILAWKIPRAEEPGRWATVYRVTKSQTRLSN